MITRNFASVSRCVAAALAAFALGGLCASAALAGGAADAQASAAHAAHAGAPVLVREDVALFAAVPGTVYLNGGVGRDEQARMHKDAHHWPLRMTFSDQSSNEFVADVALKVFDAHGQAVLRLRGAGPMTYVQLPQGDYQISARYKGDLLTRAVHIGAKGLDVNFHWMI